jgi:hypothetical protein
MNNFGRCLEYGLGIEVNVHRAAQCYRMAAELGNGAGENNFGLCLERGIGVRSNLELAAEYYKRASDHGDADGANNFGFCLEHGRGVTQNIEEAALYYRLASNRGHPEGDVNHRRCLRLLGRWRVPSEASEQKPLFEEPPTAADGPFERSLTEFAQMKLARSGVLIENWHCGGALGEGKFSVVGLLHGPGSVGEPGGKRAMKTLRDPGKARYFEREKSIHQRLNHPLIVGFEKYFPQTADQPARIVTEFVPNGSLADQIVSEQARLSSGTRIAIIIAGIVLAMRYLHFKRIIHRDLKPANILLGWDWIIRIGDFSHSVLADACGDAQSDETASLTCPASMELRYTAPESINNHPTLKSDVFSFGLILFEVLTGQPAFSPWTPPQALMKGMLFYGERPEIPEFISPGVRDLMRDCWDERVRRRPSFAEILAILEGMDFQITAGVRGEKVRQFVNAVKQREQQLGIDIDDW